jgi:hypothetical protein
VCSPSKLTRPGARKIRGTDPNKSSKCLFSSVGFMPKSQTKPGLKSEGQPSTRLRGMQNNPYVIDYTVAYDSWGIGQCQTTFCNPRRDLDGYVHLLMNAADPRALPDTNNAIFPFWSRDGRTLGFFAKGKLKPIELNGTTEQERCGAQPGRGSTLENWAHLELGIEKCTCPRFAPDGRQTLPWDYFPVAPTRNLQRYQPESRKSRSLL